MDRSRAIAQRDRQRTATRPGRAAGFGYGERRHGSVSLSRSFASDSVAIAVEIVRIRWDDDEASERDVCAIEITAGIQWSNTDRRIRSITGLSRSNTHRLAGQIRFSTRGPHAGACRPGLRFPKHQPIGVTVIGRINPNLAGPSLNEQILQQLPPMLAGLNPRPVERAAIPVDLGFPAFEPDDRTNWRQFGKQRRGLDSAAFDRVEFWGVDREEPDLFGGFPKRGMQRVAVHDVSNSSASSSGFGSNEANLSDQRKVAVEAGSLGIFSEQKTGARVSLTGRHKSGQQPNDQRQYQHDPHIRPYQEITNG